VSNVLRLYSPQRSCRSFLLPQFSLFGQRAKVGQTSGQKRTNKRDETQLVADENRVWHNRMTNGHNPA